MRNFMSQIIFKWSDSIESIAISTARNAGALCRVGLHAVHNVVIGSVSTRVKTGHSSLCTHVRNLDIDIVST